MAQCGGVVEGGDVVVRDVDTACLIHPDHVVTELKHVIAEVTFLGAAEETDKWAVANISSGKKSFSYNTSGIDT